jgi:hypothetical protein
LPTRRSCSPLASSITRHDRLLPTGGELDRRLQGRAARDLVLAGAKDHRFGCVIPVMTLNNPLVKSPSVRRRMFVSCGRPAARGSEGDGLARSSSSPRR